MIAAPNIGNEMNYRSSVKMISKATFHRNQDQRAT